MKKKKQIVGWAIFDGSRICVYRTKRDVDVHFFLNKTGHKPVKVKITTL